MKLPAIFDKFLPKKEVEKEIFSSIILGQEYAATALWEIGDHGSVHVLATDSKPCEENTWEARLDAVDAALATVEDAVGTTTYKKVVLGLPTEYLTPEGEIAKEVRGHIKLITRELELTPIGFVPLPQAILYRIQKEEGVPPSVILLEVTKTTITISLYKIGVLSGQFVKPRAADTAITLEEALKEFKDVEVLPARILLYGRDDTSLEEVKTEILRYPWTTRVNFLHFPKIEIIPPTEVVTAVALGGASELSHEVGEMEEEIEEPQEIKEEESNVIAVDPSSLGFKQNVDVREEEKQKPKITLPAFTLPNMPQLPHLSLPSGNMPIIAGGVVLVVILGLLYWFVPHVTVAVSILPKALTASETITIDPSASSVDGDNKVIPGAAVSKSESGTKTIPVTGTKNIGDPAKGPVTIYNKSASSDLALPKGTILSSGSLEFTTDSDVDVASASTTISDTGGSTTFGTGTVNITASQIGTDSNLPASATFSIQGYSSDIGVARNSAALSGGTSKTVTVVSRADEDAFVKAVSADIVTKAQQDLSGSMSGSQKLINQTITTAVTQKNFTQELDQQATSLTGNATITVSGTSYNEDDVKTLMKAAITGQIPSGYTLADDRTQVTLDDVKVGKTGKITATATIKTDAIPTIDAEAIQKNLAGKSITDAQNYLRSITGVASAEFRFSLSLIKSRLPMNVNNITVTTSIQ